MAIQKKKLVKAENPNRRAGRLNSRANNTEMHVITKKAFYYDGGDLSKYIRRACLGYDKPKGVTK